MSAETPYLGNFPLRAKQPRFLGSTSASVKRWC